MEARTRIVLAASGVVLTLASYATIAIPVVSLAPHAPAARPAPPYPSFAGQTFEPSAAAFDPATGRVLVLSDKDATLYRYERSAGRLTLPAGERHSPLRLPAGMEIAKLEGLTRLPSGAFLAVTAFDRPDPSYRRLVRFTYAPGKPSEALPVALDEGALAGAIRAASGLPWYKIEGLAVDRTGTRLFFGVRNVGWSWAAPRDVVMLLRCPLAGDRVGAPEAVIRLSTAEALGGLSEGLSDLQLDADGESFLLLTSHEGAPDSREAHSGHLFQLQASVLLRAPARTAVALGAPLRGFRAKPEGLAVEPSGALVVVFDDDREFKHLFTGYEQSDGLFTVIEPH